MPSKFWRPQRAQRAKQSTAPSSRTTLARNLRRFDKGGEQFYDQISALHKSVRGSDPDASLYWLVRMLDGGADPLYLGAAHRAHGGGGHRPRRPARAAPRARCRETYERLGSPEGELALAEAVLYLAVRGEVERGLHRL